MTEETLFIEALEVPDPAERAAFLDRACGGDTALRVRLDRLLDQHARAGSFLGRAAPLAPVGTLDAPGVETTGGPPSVRPDGGAIGPYQLVGVIGEGGMGTVWLARQQEPVKRVVALKLIKAGMDSKQVIARFEAERQALALMDHPNIAKVLDAGTTGEKPKSEARNPNEAGLDFGFRASDFRAAGRPYFVMELVQGVPITKYCDEHRLAPRQRLELFVPVCQAVQHAHQKGIIHRDLKPSNVLVTLCDGRPVPKVIDFGVAKAAGQPLTEKTLITDLGMILGTMEYMSPEQAEIDHQDIDTRSDIYALGVLLYELLAGSPPFSRQELERVGLLDMLRVIREQEPAKPSTRLSTAAALPTLAANRGTEPAKLLKLVRGELDWIAMKALEKDRNRRYESANDLAMDVQRYLADEPVQAGPPSAAYRLRKYARKYRTVLAAGAAFAALLVAATVGSIALASWGLRERNHADQQKQSAEANFQRALEAVDRMLTRVGEVQLAHVPQMELVRRDLLRDALGFYQEFLRERGDSPVVRAEAARAYRRVALIQVLLGQRDEGEAAYGQALALLKELAAESPDDPAVRDTLAGVHNDLAGLYHSTRRWPQAEAAFQQAVDLREQLAREHPTFVQNRRTLAATHGNLVILYRQMGALDKAETAFLKCRTILTDILASEPKDVKSRVFLARGYQNVGLVYGARERAPEAEAAYLNALDLFQQLNQDEPDEPAHQIGLAQTHNNLGLLYTRMRQNDKAEASHRQSLALKKVLVEDHPKVVDFRVDLGGSYGNMASHVRRTGSAEESLEWSAQAIRTLEPVLAKDARHVGARMALFDTLMGRAYALVRLGRRDDAAQDWRRAIEVSEGQPHINMRLYRPLVLAFLGEHGRATAESEAVLAAGHGQGPNLFLFASAYSLSAAAAAQDERLSPAQRQQTADKYGARAVELLHQARAAGYFRNPRQVADLKEQKDLDAIRARPDFQKLLADVETK